MPDPILTVLKQSRQRRRWVAAVLLALVAVAVTVVVLRFDPAADMIEGRYMEAAILATALIFSAFVLGYFYVQRQWLAANASVTELLSEAIAESARQRYDMGVGGSKPEPGQPAPQPQRIS